MNLEVSARSWVTHVCESTKVLGGHWGNKGNSCVKKSGMGKGPAGSSRT